MAFKMKGPSLHQGTKKYQDAVQAERVASVNMQAASPNKHIQKDNKERLKNQTNTKEEHNQEHAMGKIGADHTGSPAKLDIGGIFGDGNKKLTNPIEKGGTEKDLDKELTGNPAPQTTKKTTTKKKPVRVMTPEERKKINKKEDSDIRKAKRKATAKKVKGAISKGAKKAANYVKDKTMMTKEDIAQRKEEKPHTAKGKIRGMDDPKERLKERKKRRSGIADTLEYIFLDGKRPDDKKVAAKQKKIASEKDAMHIEKYNNEQNGHTGYTPKSTKTAAEVYEANQARYKKNKKANTTGKFAKNYNSDGTPKTVADFEKDFEANKTNG